MFQVRDLSEVGKMLLSEAGELTWGLAAALVGSDCTNGDLAYCRNGGDDDTKAPTGVGLSGLLSLTDSLELFLQHWKMGEQSSSLDAREYLPL